MADPETAEDEGAIDELCGVFLRGVLTFMCLECDSVIEVTLENPTPTDIVEEMVDGEPVRSQRNHEDYYADCKACSAKRARPSAIPVYIVVGEQAVAFEEATERTVTLEGTDDPDVAPNPENDDKVMGYVTPEGQIMARGEDGKFVQLDLTATPETAKAEELPGYIEETGRMMVRQADGSYAELVLPPVTDAKLSGGE